VGTNRISKRLEKALPIFASIVACGLLSSANDSPVGPTRSIRRSLVAASSVPSSLTTEYNRIKAGFTQESARWRNGLIEHQNIVQVLPNTVKFHKDEIIMETTPKYAVSGLQTFSLANTKGFTKTKTVSTEIQITATGETALAVGLEIVGVTLSSERTDQSSFSYGESHSYSTSYSTSMSVTATYSIANMPYVQTDGTICGCLVGDYFEADAQIKEVEYWWHGTYETLAWETFRFRVYTYTYYTYIFSNGRYGSATARPY